jgi:beta-hydroxylase
MEVIESLRRRRRKVIKKFGKNLIRRLSGFLGRQSLVGDEPVMPADQFEWTKPLEANWRAIRAELDEVLVDREKLPSFHEISPDQDRISKGDNWKTYVFFGFKHKSEVNCARCPETTRVLESIPNLQNAWFSILAPGYHIPPHRGVTKSLLRCHLALVVPDDAENCTMRVADRTFHWEEGKCVVLDDTFEHEVRNDTDQQRVVLFLDIDRPMRLPGRIVSKVFIALLKRSAYVQDGLKNLAAWEERYEAAN